MEADGELLIRLRSGDERAFVSLVQRDQEQMLRLASTWPRCGRRSGSAAAWSPET